MGRMGWEFRNEVQFGRQGIGLFLGGTPLVNNNQKRDSEHGSPSRPCMNKWARRFGIREWSKPRKGMPSSDENEVSQIMHLTAHAANGLIHSHLTDTVGIIWLYGKL
jgi:hypothetical protein